MSLATKHGPNVEQLPASSWEAVLARLRGIGYQTSGNVAMVTMRVLTRNGAPVLWWEPQIARLEPRAAFCEFLQQCETGDVPE